ncbi:SprT-like family-domain-containing protein [Aspergillus undulatus]|uniref:SprT-like family-domain-containing protein n=1 Tax=Aspergillus undulatus TaxID=1810928 RepID=UPI003CCD6C37
MARLNTRSQASHDSTQDGPRARPQRLTKRYVSPPPPTPSERRRGLHQRTMTTGTLFDESPRQIEKPTPALRRTKSTRSRTKTVSEQHFDIFADSDGTTERDTPKAKKAPTPLKLARTNSMVLPIPQQPRARTSRKSELYNYDKENDPLEEELDPGPTSLSRNPSDASASSARRSPTRGRTNTNASTSTSTQQFMTYRQPSPQQDSEDDNDDGDSFNSLDDFIVSDNEEPSYHETSDDETEEKEEQHKVSPPPTQRRRLIRGRKPNPAIELENALRESSQRPDLRLEPSLPPAFAAPPPSPKSDRVSRKLFQRDTNVSDKMDRLNLEDSDPSAQLQDDLFGAVARAESPAHSQTKDDIFQTPPSSPSKGLLRSPTKGRVLIPLTPHRESTDAFWSLEETNNWIDEHSPRKVNQLLREFHESDSDSETMSRSFRVQKPVKTPSKTALKKAETEAKKAALARKKSFDSRKAAFAEDFFKVLDDAVSGGEVQRRSADTGGVRIIWSKTLQTTAGRANWRRDRSLPDSTDGSSGSETPRVQTTKHYATIELAERIVDDEDRLLNTLAHEYCHLANYIVSNIRNNPHGASFQAWGRKCKESLKDHPIYGGRIEVTTKHSYKIDYKYVWTCVDCCQNYGRHSKSIDPARQRCGKCKGLLQQIKPKPRSVSPKKKQATPAAGAVSDMAKGLEVVNLSP